MHDIRENEHQEVFHLGCDLSKPLALHIPSPLGHLTYFAYVRLPAAQAARLGQLRVEIVLDGMYSTDTVITPSQVGSEADFDSKQPGSIWRCLGTAKLARGDGTLTITGWPHDLTPVDLLLCTWPRFVSSGMADEWIACQSDPRWAPTGVPLGGIGCGRIDICRDGRFRNFSLNQNQDAPIENAAGLAGAGLAIETDGVICDLASPPLFAGHQSCPDLSFRPRFPQVTLGQSKIFPGIDVEVTLSGTLVPHDLRVSSIPGFVIRWRVTNGGTSPRLVNCRFAWPNLIGIGGGVASLESGIGAGDGAYRHWDDPTGRREVAVVEPGFSAVCFTGRPGDDRLSSHGEHWIGVAGQPGITPDTIIHDGVGTVIARLKIEPGMTVSVNMALAAAMPHWIDTLKVDRGMYWRNHFTHGQEMLQHLLSHADDLLGRTGALAEHLDDGSLPPWLGRRLSNCNYPLVTNSVLYQDGRFSINESPTEMAGCYGTLDQRLASHAATQLLMPKLNARELDAFAAVQSPDGGMNHDLGSGHLEKKASPVNWPDLTCSYIIQTARHTWSLADDDFGREHWPRVKAALRRHGIWADEGEGVAQVGKGLGTSYDCYHYLGTTGYVGTLWLAALQIGLDWGGRIGDTAMESDLVRWRDAANKRLEEDLWNGRHYIAYASRTGPRRETCHAGQLAGQVFTSLLCGRDVLPRERLVVASQSLCSLNGSARFPVPPDEASPDRDSGSLYGCVPYIEAFMLAPVATVDPDAMLVIWERTIAAVEDENRHPCDTRMIYRPRTGEPSWGAYYMTSTASWLVYDAWLGFFFDADLGLLRLRVMKPGRYPLVHPRFWGTVSVASDGNFRLEIRKVFGEPLIVRKIEPAANSNSVVVNGAMATSREDRRQFTLPQPLTLNEGDELSWQVLK